MLLIVGKITIPTPGTLVRVTETAEYQAALQAIGLDMRFKTVQAILFEAWKGNVGQVYLGGAALVRASGAGVSHVFVIPTTSALSTWGASNHLSPAGVDVSALYLDADTANDGVLVTALVS